MKTAAMTEVIQTAYGCSWLLSGDDLDEDARRGTFEPTDVAFVARYLKPGMKVVDVGAHHGYYTMLAAKLVGRDGLVFAFEPSKIQYEVLKRNVEANKFDNVLCVPWAVGEFEEEAEFYEVGGTQTGLSSLRPPGATEPITIDRVHVYSLRHFGVRLDFVKLDAEGAEFGILRAASFTHGNDRPVILCETQDGRTGPWGYKAIEIVRLLESRGFSWFETIDGGSLRPRSRDDGGNLVAVPEEKLSTIEEFRICR